MAAARAEAVAPSCSAERRTAAGRPGATAEAAQSAGCCTSVDITDWLLAVTSAAAAVPCALAAACRSRCRALATRLTAATCSLVRAALHHATLAVPRNCRLRGWPAACLFCLGGLTACSSDCLGLHSGCWLACCGGAMPLAELHSRCGWPAACVTTSRNMSCFTPLLV